MTEVWVAWRIHGVYEPEEMLGVAGSVTTAQWICREAAAPPRSFLTPPTRLPHLAWRCNYFDDDDEDSGSLYADYGNVTYRVEKVQVQDAH